MMYSALLIAASAALVSAQATLNSTTDQYMCPPDSLTAAYCAGGSLTTNIILRCGANGVAQGGNCNDNLAGEPGDVSGAECWESSSTAGDAACAKNCIIYGDSGNGNWTGTKTIPGCTQMSTASSTAASSTATSISYGTTVTSTYTYSTVCTTDSTTTTSYWTTTTTYCPESTLSTITTSTTPTIPLSTATSTSSIAMYTGTGTGGSSPTGPSNGTLPGSSTSVGGGSGGSATATPKSPTSTGSSIPSTFSGAAIANSVGSGLAGVGLVIAYFL